MSDAERFWAKVIFTSKCWEWDGGHLPRGYSRFRFDGKDSYAHRFAYIMAYGPIPEGQEIDHKCHNPGCVNPGHLQAKTHKQNTENFSGPTRANKSSGLRGVYWDKSKQKWMASVGHNGRNHFAGYFDDPELASQAAIAKRNELFTNNLVDQASEQKDIAA